jgi:hypothetical protein
VQVLARLGKTAVHSATRLCKTVQVLAKSVQKLSRLCKTATHLLATAQVLANDDAHSSVTVQLLQKTVHNC